MSFWVKTSTLAMGYGGVGGASYMVYDTVTPKTVGERLAWEGIVIIGDSNIQAYKAVYEEKKSELQTDISEIKNDTDLDAGYKALKKWCTEKVLVTYTGDTDNLATLDKVKKWCVDKHETVKGRLIRLSAEAESVLKTLDDDYKVIFVLYRSDTTNDFLGFVKDGSSDDTLTASTDVNTGYAKLKAACSSKLGRKIGESVDSTDLRKVYWWCTPTGFKTVNEKLQKDKYEFKTTDEKFKETFNTWKYTDQVMESLKTKKSDLSKDSSETDGQTAVKEWCTEQKTKNLYDNDIYPQKYIQVKSVCVEKSSQ